ncbi:MULTISPECIES: DUF4232 domain-containing protein [unclassified Streptomyces]|uniref:DUF4232 domain-containing protein n=1 Tax=unclassified Streptomyces TaxID=2593676 RepID=UPI000DBA808D|nr:DUF4232 domain-containing protein [Streptomyces sp. PsTaAH-130]MYU05928.1 DUF4232 domain-containing protein [Streptomyces sp. SID8366]MYU67196.1 DUF4232 domain-containing protein [Streptomyces sp. SID69]RAJ63987.1 uncharacterized protein DUF4232 [Streptomyces sp. PsTaAH-130]
MVYTPRSARRGALFAGSVAVLGLLTACGNGQTVHSDPPMTSSGTAAPASGDSSAPASSGASTTSSPASSTHTGAPATASTRTTATSGGGTTDAASTRCHTSELRASVGRNDPGAGQENFPVVLTNTSGRTCTVRGFPGAAFVNASGGQLGPNPGRESGSSTTVTLKPGQSAWAGLTFSNPGVSGAKTAKPAALLITPPNERDHLKVTWTGGEVPVSGNSSAVFLTVFSPGTAP